MPRVIGPFQGWGKRSGEGKRTNSYEIFNNLRKEDYGISDEVESPLREDSINILQGNNEDIIVILLRAQYNRLVR